MFGGEETLRQEAGAGGLGSHLSPPTNLLSGSKIVEVEVSWNLCLFLCKVKAKISALWYYDEGQREVMD